MFNVKAGSISIEDEVPPISRPSHQALGFEDQLSLENGHLLLRSSTAE